MTSPVDTSVKHFHSAMEGAPVLTGAKGSLIALLDACLVTGFGLKTATALSVSAGEATLTFAAPHPATPHAVLLIEGVTGALAALNGEQKVTAASPGQLRFATALPDGTATGAITFKMAPAGWSKSFAATNIAVYRSPDVESTRMFLQINDTTAGFSRLRGYENMTSATAGTGPFPALASPYGGFNKSAAPDSTVPITWALVANQKTIFVSVVGYSHYDPLGEAGRTVLLGDFIAYRPGGDPYAFTVGCGQAAGGYSDSEGVCDQADNLAHFAPRAHHGLGGSVACEVWPETGLPVTSGTDRLFGEFPGAVDGALRLSRRLISEAVNAPPRGQVPGLYTSPQNGLGLYFQPRTTLTGTGALAGRELLVIGCGASSASVPSSSLGISFIDITGPWE